MKKELPKIKKSLKSFFTDEDAKIKDTTATKIALTSTFIAANILVNIENVNACSFFEKHNNHSNHTNYLNAPENAQTNIHAGENPLLDIYKELAEKTVETIHANHYNLIDECSFHLFGGLFNLGSNNPASIEVKTYLNKIMEPEVLEKLKNQEINKTK